MPGVLEMNRGLRILAAVVLGLVAAGKASGEEQASAPPVLRLETGMHTAPIRAAAVDAGGKPAGDGVLRQDGAAVVARDRRAAAGAAPGDRLRRRGRAFRGRDVAGRALCRDRRLDRLRMGEGEQPLRLRNRERAAGPAHRRAAAGDQPARLVAQWQIRRRRARRRQRYPRLRDRRLAHGIRGQRL